MAPPAGSGEMLGELAEELYMWDVMGHNLFSYGADVDDTSDDECQPKAKRRRRS